jgi:hypothetical protein
MSTPQNNGPRWGSLGVPLLLSLTLGLAPFAPEPHLFGKLRWVAGGAVGMSLVDWGDLLMHATPWLWLLVTAVVLVVGRGRAAPTPTEPDAGAR